MATKTENQYAIGGDKWPGLAKLIEECGEVIQVAGKLMGSDGDIRHWDGTNLEEKFVEELGDLIAATWFFIERNFNDDTEAAIVQRSILKGALYNKWQDDFNLSLEQYLKLTQEQKDAANSTQGRDPVGR